MSVLNIDNILLLNMCRNGNMEMKLLVCNPRYPILNLTWRVTSTFLCCTKMWLGHIKKQKLPLEAHMTTSSSYQMNVSSSVPVINSLLVIKHFYARVNAEVPGWIVVISPEKQTGNLCFSTWGTLRRLFFSKPASLLFEDWAFWTTHLGHPEIQTPKFINCFWIQSVFFCATFFFLSKWGHLPVF